MNKKIPFKAVAVDMDGTFVNDNKEYDHQKFQQLLTKLKEHGIQFIAASGRPASRLEADFAGFTQDIDLVADNGAVLVQHNNIIKTVSYSKEAVLKLIKIIENKFPAALPLTLISGIKHTYCLTTLPDERKDMMFFYYPNTIEIKSFQELPDDQYTKVTISYQNTIGKELERNFNEISNEKTIFKTSGFENIDLVPEGVDKASGLKALLAEMNIKPEETIVLGDSGNDLEMLKMTKMSYAMANGTPEAKKAAQFTAPSNNDDGVFKILNQYL